VIVADQVPSSVLSVSAIVQQLVKVGVDWRIERRSVGPARARTW
jgi:hypothetical protein